MAVSSKNTESSSDVARESAQPEAVDVDVVAMVSRDANGDPAQTVNYRVLVGDDADRATKDAAHNLLGAKHVDRG